MEQNIKKMTNKKKSKPFNQAVDNYNRLCRGEPTKESKNTTEASKLYCRFYDNNRQPSLILQPARQEDMNFDPFIQAYRDVISESEMRKLKDFAKPKLEISMVNQRVPGKGVQKVKSDNRVSKGFFLRLTNPKYHQILKKLQSRISAITGLKSVSYEPLQDKLTLYSLIKIMPALSYGSGDMIHRTQIANYGIGGYYMTHTDFSVNHQNASRNERIATFMFYLHEVEAGGATVFPHIGVRMAPSKGDAVFWYNLHRNTVGNMKTFHAACPVLLGTKWVANEWIGRHHQEFIRSCSLNENE